MRSILALKTRSGFDRIGEFKCCQCGSVFEVDPGLSGCHVRCPKDGSIYAEWLDWERFVKEAISRRG